MNAEGRGDRRVRNGAAEPRADAVAAPQDALHVMTERFEAAIQASHVVVFNQDIQLRYTWILNPAPGYNANEAIGKRDTELFERGDDAARTEAIKHRVIETGMGERQEVTIAHQGAERCYDLSVQPQRDASGLIVGVTCAAVDITTRKQDEANVAFLVELSDALTPAVSPQEIARVAAERIARHFGLSRCLLVEIDRPAASATVFYDYSAGSEQSLADVYRISDFHNDDERRRLAAGEPVAVDDVRDAPRTPDAAALLQPLGHLSVFRINDLRAVSIRLSHTSGPRPSDDGITFGFNNFTRSDDGVGRKLCRTS